MLKRANQNDIAQIKLLCANSIIGTRILCYITAYGFERNFLEVWVIENDGVINGVLTKFYDDITLLVDKTADAELLSAFLNMFYYKTLMCHSDVSKILGFNDSVDKNGYCYIGLDSDYDYETDLLIEDDFKSAYDLICEEIPGSFRNDPEAYLSFLSDFTFRQRRGLARGVCTHFDNKLSSVALTSSETPDSAIISGVACEKSMQKKGLGKTTVLSLVNLLKKENKNIYVIALNESAEGFYKHIGFVKKEKISFVERKNYV